MTRTQILNKLNFYSEKVDTVANFRIKQYYMRKFNALLKQIERYNVVYDYDNPQDVIDLMIKEFGCSEDFATSTRRYRDKYVYPRQMTMALCRHIFKHKPLKYIGEYFTNGDHANILHALKNVKNMYDTDKEYRKKFDTIQKYFLGNIEIK